MVLTALQCCVASHKIINDIDHGERFTIHEIILMLLARKCLHINGTIRRGMRIVCIVTALSITGS